MNFQESVSYLYSLGHEILAMKLGLENIAKLLQALNNPQKKYLKIQIAGTNGKGSTCAFLEAICRKAGIKTGMTTSPHLVSIRERVRLNGKLISEKDFARQTTQIKKISEQLVKGGELETLPTFFEQLTAISLNYFADQKVEIAILETGLGGRFDATTAARAEIVALTPIDYDHQRILGETLAEISAEKAAIIRADTRVIAAPQKKEAERVIIGKCREMKVEPVWATTNFQIKKDEFPASFPMLFATFKTLRDIYPNVLPGLKGRHQFTNAATTIAVAETLRDFNFEISSDAIIGGLETADHPGRLEFWQNFLFDGAHNAAGAKILREFLDEFVKRPVIMVFGAMRDKDVPEIAGILFPCAKNVILTKPDNPRSMAAADLFQSLPEEIQSEKVLIDENVTGAIKTAKFLAGDDGLICVTGSLYLIGEVKELLGEIPTEKIRIE